jgi:hypothetical protein
MATPRTAERRRPRRPHVPGAFSPHVAAGPSPFAQLAPTPARASSLGAGLDGKLSSFAAGTGNGSWPHLPRAAVAARLTELVGDPSKVDQDGLNACGPAAALHLFAKRHPERFADFVIALYEKGKAPFGSIDVSGSGLLTKNPASMAWDGPPPNPLDWMTMSSLLRTEGDVVRFSGEPSDEFSGITLPGEMERWLKSGIGYSDVDNEANKFFNKDLDHLRRLSPGDRDILVLANVDIIEGGAKKSKKSKGTSIGAKGARLFPNHYFVLEQPVSDDGTKIKAVAWTWGRSGYVFEASHSAWEDGYFGALLARA